MHINDAFEIRDVETARSFVRAHPFATLVTADLRATHMPCLADEQSDALVVIGHVARADPVAESLSGPLLAIFHGPHGYVSASWYASETIPTWNHVTLHVRGTPELLDDAMPVLRRTVQHFEAAVERPWSLARMGDTAREMADNVPASPDNSTLERGGRPNAHPLGYEPKPSSTALDLREAASVELFARFESTPLGLKRAASRPGAPGLSVRRGRRTPLGLAGGPSRPQPAPRRSIVVAEAEPRRLGVR